MAKQKKFGLSTTLKKNVPKLNEKVALKKTEKDIDAAKEVVQKIHKTEKTVRITVDTPKSLHTALKKRCIDEGMSIRDFILKLIKENLE